MKDGHRAAFLREFVRAPADRRGGPWAAFDPSRQDRLLDAVAMTRDPGDGAGIPCLLWTKRST